MTCDEFYMDVRTDHVDISVKDGRMKAEAEIYLEDFVYALFKTNDNIDMLAKEIKDELIHRAENAYDLDQISDGELNTFYKVLEVIL